MLHMHPDEREEQMQNRQKTKAVLEETINRLTAQASQIEQEISKLQEPFVVNLLTKELVDRRTMVKGFQEALESGRY